MVKHPPTHSHTQLPVSMVMENVNPVLKKGVQFPISYNIIEFSPHVIVVTADSRYLTLVLPILENIHIVWYLLK